MPTVFVANLAVNLPSRFAAGDTIDDAAAYVLNDVHRKRLTSRLRYMLAKGEIHADELQRKAEELHQAELVPYATLDDDEENNANDPIMAEALSMARELIVTRMAKEGLPPPRGLDVHAKALVDAMPSIVERARLRVEARYKAAASALEGVQ